ncbi:MAG: hypothetical protein HY868_13685 [Chloroflexi bacterium]|nr:hypothetical protein [Chloroflexota bacterium]
MNTIYIEPAQNTQVLHLVESAVQSEIARLQIALTLAKKRVSVFEEKYQTRSDKFIATMTAEDLKGGDDEYVQWAGEYKLLQRLEQKLNQLQGLHFGD